MFRSRSLTGLMAVVGCLLPLSIPAESQHAADGRRATAHLTFKIVIPQVLSVDIGETLAVGGNNPAPAVLAAGARLGQHILLSASGHRSVARFATCSGTAGDDAALNCTVSMP